MVAILIFRISKSSIKIRPVSDFECLLLRPQQSSSNNRSSAMREVNLYKSTIGTKQQAIPRHSGNLEVGICNIANESITQRTLGLANFCVFDLL